MLARGIFFMEGQMAANLKASFRREINRLGRDVVRRTSELASLKGELKMYERVHALLGAEAARGRRAARRLRRGARIDWSSVIERLPNPFTVADVAKRKEAKAKSPVYLRQIVSRWAKQKKVKRVARGKYRKF